MNSNVAVPRRKNTTRKGRLRAYESDPGVPPSSPPNSGPPTCVSFASSPTPEARPRGGRVGGGRRPSKDDSQMMLHTSTSPLSRIFRRAVSKDDSVLLRKDNRRNLLQKLNPMSSRGGKRISKKETSKSSDDSGMDSSGGGPRGILRNGDSFDSYNPETSPHYQQQQQSDGTHPESATTTETLPIPPPIRNVSFDMPSSFDFGGYGTDTSMDMTDHQQQHQQPQQRPSNRTTSEGRRARYSVHEGYRQTRKKTRVKPYHCFPEPVYMTEEDIYKDSLEPSASYEFLKSYLKPTFNSMKKVKVADDVRNLFGSPEEDGRIASLRVEVLGCISLARQKPDVAVYLVCGDSAFCTDVVHGYRSPMWPNQSRRAAVFPIHHAYARLYVGVFDVRVRKNKENDVFCGRVVVDIPSIRPHTEYDVTYPLRASSFVYDRRKRGVLRLRFSLHWFSERAAALSYFKSPQPVPEGCPLVEGSPSIPCADPKTFRNVAFTVYGQDLPGKYTRNAFRATMREFNLYQINLRVLFKRILVDAMLYEKPLFSLYLFAGGMYCVVSNSVRMVPSIIIGYVLILYLENYVHFIENSAYNLGYKPVTILEVLRGLLYLSFGGSGGRKSRFEPILAKKKAKKRSNNIKVPRQMKILADSAAADGAAEDEAEIKPLDHREFPFAERDTYPKFSIEDALAPSSKNARASNTRLHGRLSVYYTNPDAMESADEDDDDSSEDSGEEGDDETVMTESNMGDNLFMDLEGEGEDGEGEEEEEEAEEEALDPALVEAGGIFSRGWRSRVRRIKVGPPQNTDVKGKKIPPQVHLKKIEKMLHKVSLGISVEMVHAPTALQEEVDGNIGSGTQSGKGGEASGASGMTGLLNSVDAQALALKRKIGTDEFDRLLGLQTKTANPILKIASSFLGPLMRMIRILVFACRVSFNVTTWRDPFLSFWVFSVLFFTFLMSLIFPWRSFFLVVICLCFGPQNIAVRKYLEKKKAKKEAEKRRIEEEENDNGFGYKIQSSSGSDGIGNNPDKAGDESTHERGSEARGRGFFGKKLALPGRPKRGSSVEPPSERSGEVATSDPIPSEERGRGERPAFTSQTQSGTSRKTRCRAVAVPYSRMKKDRFYDWPPDPTVSRATPLSMIMSSAAAAAAADELVPEMPIPEPLEEKQSKVRRRPPPRIDISDFPGVKL